MEQVISTRLATLGHPNRLGVFRLLMRRFPDRVPATEIASALDLKPNTLSTYMNALMAVDLATRQRQGTSLRYSVNIDVARETFDYLILDCCRGRPDICSPVSLSLPHALRAETDRKFNVLFICTGNSARSIFAESILRTEAGDRFNAYSAGTNPGSGLNPFAIDVLKQKGHDVSNLRSKSIAAFQTDEAPNFDFVFTVCDQAANENCPAWTAQPVSAHWGMPDPVKAEGTDAQKSLAFQHAFGALQNRIKAFTALRFDALDRIALQQAVDHIGQSKDEPEAP